MKTAPPSRPAATQAQVSRNLHNINLDVLRAIAVMLVLMCHCLQVYGNDDTIPLELGHVGVLIFFVHAATVLMHSMDRIVVDERLPLFSTFLIRRAFRIYPLSVAVVLVCVWAWIPIGLMGMDSRAFTAKEIWSNLLLVQNLTNSTSVTAPMWSLPFEVQMYFMLPPIYLAMKRWPSIVTPWCIWALACVAAKLEGVLTGKSFGSSGDLLVYVPCFMAGVIGWRYPVRRMEGRLPGWGWPLFIAALCAIYAMVPLPAKSWLICLVLAFGLQRFRPISSLTGRKIAGAIATYSYGIYLFHTPLLWLVFRQWGPHNQVLGWFVFACAMVVSVTLAYHGIEAPLINVGKRLTRRRSVTA